MAERNAMRELSNSVCIVGVDESDEIGTLPHKSQLALHLEAITNAVRDADSRSRMWMASLRPASILRPCSVRRWESRRGMSMARVWAGALS